MGQGREFVLGSVPESQTKLSVFSQTVTHSEIQRSQSHKIPSFLPGKELTLQLEFLPVCELLKINVPAVLSNLSLQTRGVLPNINSLQRDIAKTEMTFSFQMTEKSSDCVKHRILSFHVIRDITMKIVVYYRAQRRDIHSVWRQDKQ